MRETNCSCSPGHRIAAGLRPSDTAARFGGDEFAVLLEQAGEQEAATAAERILGNLAAPFDIHDREVFVLRQHRRRGLRRQQSERHAAQRGHRNVSGEDDGQA
jgi:GGDEF domain-containing protein